MPLPWRAGRAGHRPDPLLPSAAGLIGVVCCGGTALWTSALSSMNGDLPACFFSGFRARNVHVISNSYDCCLVIKANARERARPPDTSRVMLGHPRAQCRCPSAVGVRAGQASERAWGAGSVWLVRWACQRLGCQEGRGGRGASGPAAGGWVDSLQPQHLCGRAGRG